MRAWKRATTESRQAATALLKVARKCQRGILNAADVADLPPAWWGYLHPSDEEPAGTEGQRLVVCFVANLGNAMADIFAERRGDRRFPALVHFSYIWAFPAQADHGLRRSQAEPTISGSSPTLARIPVPKQDGKERRRRKDAIELFAEYLATYPRTADVAPMAPTLVDIEEVAEWVRTKVAEEQPDWPEFLGAASLDDSGILRAFGVIVAAAVDRFTTAGASPMPVLSYLRAESQKGLLQSSGLCTKSCGLAEPNSDPQTCSCWSRLYDLVEADLPPAERNLKRERLRGGIALQLAAWQLTTGSLTDWSIAISSSSHLFNPTVVQPSDDASLDANLAALGELIQLHNRWYRGERVYPEDAPLLFKVASAIDSMSDRVELRLAASIISALINVAPWPPPNDIQVALAQLSRSAAGAFRELREPFQAMQVIRPLAGGLRWLAELKLAEARQDVQLAFQRAGMWDAGASSFHGSVKHFDDLAELVPRPNEDPDSKVFNNVADFQRKRAEIAEQLLLGRVGGVVQEAELLIRMGRAIEAVSVLEQAKPLFGLIEVELGYLEGPYLEPGRFESIPSFLRFTSRWRVMPNLMRARTAVAESLALVGASYQHTRKKSRRMEQELERVEEDYGHLFTERQRWEMNRITAVGSLVSNGLDDSLIAAGIKLIESGGDDSGDYVVPMLRWARTLPAGSVLPSIADIDEILVLLESRPVPPPRLPDLRALTM